MTDSIDKMILSRHGSDLLKAVRHTFYSMEKVYGILNQYASGEHLKMWGRVDPQALLAQVYGDLAPCFLELKEVLERAERCVGTQLSINGENKNSYMLTGKK